MASSRKSSPKSSGAKSAGNRRRSSTSRAAPPRRRITGTALVSFGTVAAAAGAMALAAWRILARRSGEGTVPTDLMGAEHPDGSARAIDAFRPDPTAPVPASERDALRPALAGAAAPTLVAGQARGNARLDAAPS